nr:GP5 [Praja virus]
MTCSLSLGLRPMFGSLYYLGFLYPILFLSGTSIASANATVKEFPYVNLTLCSFNESHHQYFKYLVEGYAVIPLFTHVIGFVAMTTATAIDTLAFGSAAYISYAHGENLILCIVYGLCGLAGFLCFCVKIFQNCKALRVACTRRTNFILSDKGQVIPYKHPYLLEKGGKTLLPDGTLVTTKAVVISGSKAVAGSPITAELWRP